MKLHLGVLATALALTTLTACTGEDEATDTTPSSQSAGDEMDKAMDEAGEKLDEAGEKAGEALDDMKDDAESGPKLQGGGRGGGS